MQVTQHEIITHNYMAKKNHVHTKIDSKLIYLNLSTIIKM